MFCFFHFSFFSVVSRFVSPVVLPYCGPRCITPLHYPVVGSKSSRQPVAKTDDLGLVPIFKKNSSKKNLWFSFFSFEFCTDITIKQLNLKKYIKIHTFFSLFSTVSPFVSPVVLPYCGPRCVTPLFYPTVGVHRDCRGDRCENSLSFSTNLRARLAKKMAHPDSCALGSFFPGDFTYGETQRFKAKKRGIQ